MNIALLLSGGVDSSVALALLKQQGHTVTAFYLKIWLEDELAFLGDCPWEQDLVYARAVAEQFSVPLEVVSLQAEYSDRVITYTIDEIKKGRTPNPDMLCNSFIKFGVFYDTIGKNFDAIASGHYAQTLIKDSRTLLKLTPDAIKDQTYFLARLSQEQLSLAMFPIGNLTKQQVRALAYSYNLANKDRKDSQGLCFLGKISFKEFIAHHVGKQQGNLVEVETNKVMGVHDGYWFYTIGQRQGIGLPGGPWFVARKDPAQNIVYISKHYYAADKKRNSFSMQDVRWFLEMNFVEARRFLVKLRHGAAMHPCTVFKKEDGFFVQLEHDDQGIAAGQFAVFYDRELCVGSGVIVQE